MAETLAKLLRFGKQEKPLFIPWEKFRRIEVPISQLQQRFSQYSTLAFENVGGLVAVRVQNGKARARIFLQGAQVTSYVPQFGREVIWLSPTCDYKEGASLRGGIPICWPWFGEFSRNALTLKEQLHADQAFPPHGFVRHLPWNLAMVEEMPDARTRLTFDLNFDGGLKAWPFRTQLKYLVTVGSTLDLSLTVSNADARAFSFAQALHTYFAVGHHANTRVEGLEGLEFIDAFADWKTDRENVAIDVGHPLNRVYQDISSPLTVHDLSWHRRIELRLGGSRSVIVWNPGAEHAKKLSHFPENAFSEMVCVENGNVLDRFVTLQPGQSHTLSTSINVETHA